MTFPFFCCTLEQRMWWNFLIYLQLFLLEEIYMFCSFLVNHSKTLIIISNCFTNTTKNYYHLLRSVAACRVNFSKSSQTKTTTIKHIQLTISKHSSCCETDFVDDKKCKHYSLECLNKMFDIFRVCDLTEDWKLVSIVTKWSKQHTSISIVVKISLLWTFKEGGRVKKNTFCTKKQMWNSNWVKSRKNNGMQKKTGRHIKWSVQLEWQWH